jgi:hypothetical protein
MIKVRRETIEAKKGRRKITKNRKEEMGVELELLERLKMTAKEMQDLSLGFQLLNEGGLVVFKNEMIPFIENVDRTTREFLNYQNASKDPIC